MALLGGSQDGQEPRRRSLAWLVAVVVVLVVAGGTAYWLLGRPSSPPSPAPTRTPSMPAAKATPTARAVPTAPETPVAPRRPEPTAAATVARLRVDADVAGASVFLDRRFLGTTPVETTDFTPGSHRLNVSAEGHDMYAETIDIPAEGREVVVRFKEVRLDESVDVVHKHGVGSCRGRLSATTAGVAFSGGAAEDGFEAPIASLEPLRVDYLKKNLRVKVKGGKTYNFTAESADALLVFQKAVEAARLKLGG